MATTNDNLRIDNPCPFVLARMNKDGDNFFANHAAKQLLTLEVKQLTKLKVQ